MAKIKLVPVNDNRNLVSTFGNLTIVEVNKTGNPPANTSGRAIYTNTATGETYTLRGVNDLAQAWNLAQFACRRAGWNHLDVSVNFFA